MKNGRTGLILTLVAVLALNSCKHEVEELMPVDSGPVWRIPSTANCDTNIVYFENQVHKIIVTKCAMTTDAGCHGSEPFATEEEKGDEVIDLRSYSSIIKYVEAGEPLSSELYERITASYELMPPEDKWQLTQEEIDLIGEWISQGALNNKCEPCEDTGFVSFEATIAPLMFKNCSGCHNDENKTSSSLLTFFAYPPTLTNINKTNVESYHAGILGTLKNSDTNSLETAMPRNIGKLYECEVNKFEQWSKSLSL